MLVTRLLLCCVDSHYTHSSTWTDPRTRQPIPMNKFEWNALPPGWERFLDHHGDIYYVKSVRIIGFRQCS